MWRPVLGDLWGAKAGVTGRVFAEHPSAVARAVVARLGRLIDRCDETTAAQREALGIAAWALETCTVVPATGPNVRSRTHVLARLEDRLREHDQRIRQGDLGYALSPRDAWQLGDRIQAAISAQGVDLDRPVGAGEAFEEQLVDLAVLAVRAAMNIAEFGTAVGPALRSYRVWREHIVGLADETDRVMRRSVGDHRGCQTDGLAWREALALRAPELAMAQVADVGTDRTLRAEALAVTRGAWLRQASSQLAILADRMSHPVGTQALRLRWVMVDVAVRRLDDAHYQALWPSM